MYLKGVLIIAPFTVQICRLCTFLTPSGRPCLSFNLVLPSEIRDQGYHVANARVRFSYQPNPRNGKAFLLLSCLQRVNQSHPSIWAVTMDLASLVLAEIHNKLLQFSTVVHQSWARGGDGSWGRHSPTTLPQLSGATSTGTPSPLLLSHFISLVHCFCRLRGKGIINSIVLSNYICG